MKKIFLLFCILLNIKLLKAQVSDTIIVVQNDILIEEEIIFYVVEETPEFPGGMKALMKYIKKHIKYPAEAKEQLIEGKVNVRFAIDNCRGKIEKVQIKQGTHPLLDAETIRIIKSLPRWKPGRARGVSRLVWFTITINFVLDKF